MVILTMEQIADLVAKLEKLLVREFHTCQTLHNLTQAERTALIQKDVFSLARVVEHKEAALDELGQLDEQRRMAMYEISNSLSLDLASPTIAELSVALGTEAGVSLKRLRDGLVALNTDIRHITHCNASLALNALERADAAQTLLLDMCSPSLSDHPVENPHQAEAYLFAPT